MVLMNRARLASTSSRSCRRSSGCSWAAEELLQLKKLGHIVYICTWRGFSSALNMPKMAAPSVQSRSGNPWQVLSKGLCPNRASGNQYLKWDWMRFIIIVTIPDFHNPNGTDFWMTYVLFNCFTDFLGITPQDHTSGELSILWTYDQGWSSGQDTSKSEDRGTWRKGQVDQNRFRV
jgi:hypothetical protein